jgi:hypothetical protein
MIIVYRDCAEPPALAAKIDVGGTQRFELLRNGLAHEIVEPGKYQLALRWLAATESC